MNATLAHRGKGMFHVGRQSFIDPPPYPSDASECVGAGFRPTGIAAFRCIAPHRGRGTLFHVGLRVLVLGALAFAVLAAAPAVANADSFFGVEVVLGGGHGRHDGRDAYAYGFERGRVDGSEHGHKDGRKCRDFNFSHRSEYRDGDRGYRRGMGPRWDYAAGYRRGYETGYRRAYASARPGWHDRDARYRYDDRYRDDDRYRYDDRYRREDRYRSDRRDDYDEDRRR